MFSFLHRPIVSIRKTSIYHQEPPILLLFLDKLFFFILQNMQPLTWFYESPKSIFSAKNLLYCFTQEKKVTYISNDLRVRELTENFNLWVNWLFEVHLFLVLLFLRRWWREEAGLKAGLQSAPSTLGVRNLCVRLVMKQEEQDGCIHSAGLEIFVRTFPGLFSSSLSVVAEILVNQWPGQSASHGRTTPLSASSVWTVTPH